MSESFATTEPSDGSLVLVYDRVFKRVGGHWEQVVTQRVRDDGVFIRYFDWDEIASWGCSPTHVLPPQTSEGTWWG